MRCHPSLIACVSVSGVETFSFRSCGIIVASLDFEKKIRHDLWAYQSGMWQKVNLDSPTLQTIEMRV